MDKTLIYFVTHGPQPIYQSIGWEVMAKVSVAGETVEDMVFKFATEEHAIKFKRDVNYTMQPVKLWNEKER